MKNLTYILDIGSSKISLMACRVDKAKSMVVTSINQEYDGFMDGEFFSTDQVKQVIGSLVEQMSARTNKKIRTIHVGVPSEFSASVCKRVIRNFVPGKKITDDDIANMFDGVEEFKASEDFVVASFSPLQYELDGMISDKLTNQRISQFVMDCSYILIRKTFIEFIKEILNELNIEEIDFISTALAQAQFVRKQNGLNSQPFVLVDVGHLTTSVAVSKGDGLMMLSSFSLGGGHITADLMQVNNLTYFDADKIKRKVSLTIQTKRDEKYVVYDGSRKIKALINMTNDIVKARIENIANVVNRILSNSAFDNLPIYLTGDGVCNFRGVINLFEVVCNRRVYIVKSPLNNGEDKYQTSKISLAQIIEDLV